ncbi:MAG: M28 family metallopeptidase [Candidatus Bathyarchaeia archaeon]
MEVVKQLVTDIGTRLSGSAGEEAAARYLASKFEEIGLEVEIERYRFLGWQLLEAPLLEILSPSREKLPCASNIYSSSTSEQGAEGTLRLIGKVPLQGNGYEKYAIVNREGEELAYVIATNQPVARNSVHDIRFPVPEVNVDLNTRKKLQELSQQKTPVRMRLKLKTEFDPQAVSHNAIGTLRGATDPERVIIVTSHLAESLVKAKPAKTVRFCSFGGEELGMYGSRYYEKRLKETGELKKVEFVLCFDEVGQEKQTHRFRATSEWLELKLRSVLEQLKAGERLGEGLIEPFPKRWVVRAFGSDHAAFVEEGVPAVSIGGGGHDGYSHTGSSGDQDTLEKVSPDIIKYKADIGLRILGEIGAL